MIVTKRTTLLCIWYLLLSTANLLLAPAQANDRGPRPHHYICINGKYIDDLSDCGQEFDRVAILIPAFSDQAGLGLNVATVLNLQLFNTLQKSPTPNPQKVSFGNATIFWRAEPLSEPTQRGAARAAETNLEPTQFVLWGTASAYAGGVFVQARLSLPAIKTARRVRREVWELTLPEKAGGSILSLDVPARQYAFEPIVLDNDIVQKYSSPAALKIYRDKSLKESVGSLEGGDFKAVGHEIDGEWLSQPVHGWLPLPELAKQTSEIIEFTGGLIRIFRSDWNGATTLLRKVLEHPSTPTSIRIDTLLYLGLAAEKQQRSGRAEIEQAYNLNPLSQASASYLIMSAFSDYKRATSSLERKAAVDRIGSLLEQNSFLFPRDSKWFSEIDTAYLRVAGAH
jgi:hypothetical protein